MVLYPLAIMTGGYSTKTVFKVGMIPAVVRGIFHTCCYDHVPDLTDIQLTIPPAMPLAVHMERTERRRFVSAVMLSFWARDMRYKNRK